MKMPENMTCWPPFSRQRNKASGQPAFAMAYLLAADIMAVRLQKQQLTQRCAIIAQFIRDLLDFAGLSSNLGLYNERVYRLHRY